MFHTPAHKQTRAAALPAQIQMPTAGRFIVGYQEGQQRPWFVMSPDGQIVDRQHECWVANENAAHLGR